MPASKIYFHFLSPGGALRERKRLKEFLRSLLKKEGKSLSRLDYIFCSDAYLQKINKEFLGHHDFTDIISFSLSAERDPLVGEIYISLDRVRENAGLYNASFMHELHRVIFHGALHLSGYKDKTAKQKKKMRFLEEQYLGLYFS